MLSAIHSQKVYRNFSTKSPCRAAASTRETPKPSLIKHYEQAHLRSMMWLRGIFPTHSGPFYAAPWPAYVASVDIVDVAVTICSDKLTTGKENIARLVHRVNVRQNFSDMAQLFKKHPQAGGEMMAMQTIAILADALYPLLREFANKMREKEITVRLMGDDPPELAVIKPRQAQNLDQYADLIAFHASRRNLKRHEKRLAKIRKEMTTLIRKHLLPTS